MKKIFNYISDNYSEDTIDNAAVSIILFGAAMVIGIFWFGTAYAFRLTLGWLTLGAFQVLTLFTYIYFKIKNNSYANKYIKFAAGITLLLSLACYYFCPLPAFLTYTVTGIIAGAGMVYIIYYYNV